MVGDPVQVQTQTAQLRHFLPLVEKVIAQTQERVWKGNRHVVGKVLSLFEPHTQVIRKGKAHKPTEFGRLVRIDEVENGLVSGYQVLEGNPADTHAWDSGPGAAPSLLRAAAADGHRRPRLFLGEQRARSPGAGGGEGGPAGPRASVGHTGAPPEAALVPASAARAGGQ